LSSEETDIDKIINGCKAGNRQAQEQLYQNYYGAMINLCLRYTKNEVDAMEVLNTGFYKIFKHIDKYNTAKASFYTWIRTIIINSCLNFIKAKETQTETKELEQAADINVPPVVITNMSASEILMLVRQLAPATQAVFNLYVLEGYNHNEISAMMKISSGTSKWHLSEARKKLQKMINEQQIINE
jgi:RNA polymerase sigma factor (sigma-70 family)